MTDILDLNFCNGISAVSIPSTIILPSRMPRRNMAANNEVFPAPVLPTTPIYTYNKEIQCKKKAI